MIQNLAWVFGIVFLVVGVLGFVPGVTMDEMFLGIFHVDALHNVVHVISGLAVAFFTRDVLYRGARAGVAHVAFFCYKSFV